MILFNCQNQQKIPDIKGGFKFKKTIIIFYQNQILVDKLAKLYIRYRKGRGRLYLR